MSYKFIFYILVGSFLLVDISCKQEQVLPKEKIDSPVVDTTKPNTNKKTIVFFGNSLTAGYGLDEQYSFPSLIQKRIDSLQLNYNVINAGLSGETTADGKNRINWILKQKIDVFVLELGANDVLRGMDLKQTEVNLKHIVEAVKAKYPEAKIIIAGMIAPENMGKSYTTTFNNIYPKLAKDYDAELIPFLLKDVAMVIKLNLQDGKHPNAEGQKLVMENVWQVLKNVL